ncbi:MAG: hypothetical protein COV57_00870 [Candidatus Liptonbacteria bacterium CG11_big_fil_rev_8_21_14_0_20_35_14]|uniref:t-SNARE coiled-coil homology domain-containing protein n=1 Tax=Candidatus Liptonbacteria bacterium CG11_big_fil_rev_8_21_14_0_20_35_14 TaxID=1974634 RepID=A0A2H0N8B4_9BACT|nr:MAG: hypothetical protein COV57_00870 [Candidatus Liptonbacteria bacterium CG11_big_fil_rev_8_21_14_0_20_35_14]
MIKKKPKMTLKKSDDNQMTLEKLATLTQQGFLELKSDINEVKVDLNEVKVDLNEVKVDLNEVKADLNSVKNDLVDFKDEMSGHLDNIHGQLKDLNEGNTFSYAEYRRQEKTLINHETRLSKLEKSKV